MFVCIIILGWTSLISGIPFCSVLIFFFFSLLYYSFYLLVLVVVVFCVYMCWCCVYTRIKIYILQTLKADQKTGGVSCEQTVLRRYSCQTWESAAKQALAIHVITHQRSTAQSLLKWPNVLTTLYKENFQSQHYALDWSQSMNIFMLHSMFQLQFQLAHEECYRLFNMSRSLAIQLDD